MKMYETFKTAFGNKPREVHRLLSGFLHSDMGKLRLKIVSVQVVPLQVAQMKT
jgi:hypothetical protein